MERRPKAAVVANIRFGADLPVFFPESVRGDIVPHRVLSQFSLLGQADACVVCLSMTGAEMMADPRAAARRVLDAVLFAQEGVGADVVGLTSLTSSVTMQGRWLADRPEVKVALTHGDSYASVLTVDGVRQAVEKTGRSMSQVVVGVLGAYGLIGRAVSLSLAETGCRLVLIGPNPNKLAALAKHLPGAAGFVQHSTSLSALAEADVVVTATSNADALVSASVLKDRSSRVIIYEVSVPPNLPRDAYQRLRVERPNVVKIDGAMAAVPGVDVGFSIPDVVGGTTYSCWAETFMQVMEGDTAHHVGEIDLQHMDVTATWARKHGFGHAPFTCFGEPIPEEEFRLS